jgi:hypothetical protein
VFSRIKAQAPRFDTTFLAKRKAQPGLKAAGPVHLYKMAWYLHFKEIVRPVSEPGDVVYAIVGALYNLGVTQRITADLSCPWFQTCIEPTLVSRLMPWGEAW